MKVPLEILIKVLQDTWDIGADYVDIIGVPDAIQEEISIAVRDEYISSEEDDDNDEEDNSSEEQTDLNDLI